MNRMILSSSSQSEDPVGKANGRGHIAQGLSKLDTDDGYLLSSSAGSADLDTSAGENAINNARLGQYRQEFTTHLLSLIGECDFEYGFTASVDTFIRERLAENELATKEWLNDLFVRYWDDMAVLTGLLRAIAHLDYDEVCPAGPTMAIAALSHKSVEVRECGVRAFENWAASDAVSLLEHLRCPERWLQEYVDDVIADLKRG